jgi:naringenin degradation protein FdeD
MVIRHGTQVRVYVNACPHNGLTLDLVPGRFLNRERSHILCATHGALFRIEDGNCVAGPCRGGRLTSVRTAVCEGVVRVASGKSAASCVGS